MLLLHAGNVVKVLSYQKGCGLIPLGEEMFGLTMGLYIGNVLPLRSIPYPSTLIVSPKVTLSRI